MNHELGAIHGNSEFPNSIHGMGKMFVLVLRSVVLVMEVFSRKILMMIPKSSGVPQVRFLMMDNVMVFPTAKDGFPILEYLHGRSQDPGIHTGICVSGCIMAISAGPKVHR